MWTPGAMKAELSTAPGSPLALRGPPSLPLQPPRLSGRNRYSFFVSLFKVLLPAMAAALILLVAAWPQFMIEDPRFRLVANKLVSGQTESLTMLNPRYSGSDEKSRPYTITADMATQSRKGASSVELELPKGDIKLGDDEWLAVTARTGQFQRDKQILDLNGSVSLFHDRGFELHTEAARIDLDRGTAQGDASVVGQGGQGSIEAEGFQVLDRGRRVIFTGKSHLIIRGVATRDAL